MKAGIILIISGMLSVGYTASAQESKQKTEQKQTKELNKAKKEKRKAADDVQEEKWKEKSLDQSSNKKIKKHYTIIISGDVQNVGFRHNAKLKAKDLGIQGFARNEKDGTVYIEAEGTEEALKKFVEFCKTGPEEAKVKNVTVKEGEIQNYDEFNVERFSDKKE